MRIGFASAVPIAFLLFALGYIAFTLSLDVERMIGDDFGYDPGSRFMPLAIAILLAITMLWELTRTVRAGAVAEPPLEEGSESVPRLLALNIALSVLFLVAFRPLGFVLATCLLLYGLTFVNLRHLDPRLTIRAGLVGLVATLAYAIALYSLARWVIRTCFWLAREHGLTIARDANLQAGLVVLVSALTLFVVHKILARLDGVQGLVALIQTTVGVTMSVYVVFRLMFLVQLPAGLLTW